MIIQLVFFNQNGKIKSYQMSQKFIYSAEKTAKKSFNYQEEKQKKFSRKRSERQKSTDSKRSKQDSICSQYIKTPLGSSFIKFDQINQSAMNFVQQFNNSLQLQFQEDTNKRKSLYNRTNTGRQKNKNDNASTIRIQMLETQINIKEGQSRRYKMQLDEQREKRRKCQNDKRSILKQFQEIQKMNEKLQTDYKKLSKQKEYLLKQIQFLERINYDETTRNIQSYREKILALELQKYKENLLKSRSEKELQLLKEIQQTRHQKDMYEEQYRSSSYFNNVLLFQLGNIQRNFHELRIINREKIMNSPEYIELRERYRRFIETYKQVRAQNWTLRNLVDRTQVQLEYTDED